MFTFARHCHSCGEIFEHPIVKQFIGEKTQHADGSLTIEKAEDVLVSPCCDSGYCMYHGDSDTPTGIVSDGINLNDEGNEEE